MLNRQDFQDLKRFENWRAEDECSHLHKLRKAPFSSKMTFSSHALVVYMMCFWLLGRPLKILHMFYLLLLYWYSQFLLYCVSQVNVPALWVNRILVIKTY